MIPTNAIICRWPHRTLGNGIDVCVCVFDVEQVVEEQNTAAIRDLCRALQQHRLLESPHLHVRSLALEVTEWLVFWAV